MTNAKHAANRPDRIPTARSLRCALNGSSRHGPISRGFCPGTPPNPSERLIYPMDQPIAPPQTSHLGIRHGPKGLLRCRGSADESVFVAPLRQVRPPGRCLVGGENRDGDECMLTSGRLSRLPLRASSAPQHQRGEDDESEGRENVGVVLHESKHTSLHCAPGERWQTQRPRRNAQETLPPGRSLPSTSHMRKGTIHTKW